MKKFIKFFVVALALVLSVTTLTACSKCNQKYADKINEKAEAKEKVVMGFRPECCAVEDLGTKNVLKEELLVEVSEMLGDTMNIYGYVGKNNVVVRTNPFTKYVVGEPLRFDVLHEHIIFFDAESENIID